MIDNLSQFVRRCEATITQAPEGRAFLPADARDQYRVYAMAKLVGIVSDGADVEEMLLAAPGMYEALLRAYHSLREQRANALWWQRVEDATAEGWPACVRDAISDVAKHLEVPARALAIELDGGAYPRMRQLVLDRARQRLGAA